MPKRYTDTLKWSDPWFRKLKPKSKLLWQYLCDNCDNAGMWKEDLDLASFNIGDKITMEDIDHLNNGKHRVINTEKGYWLIKDFIRYQIGNLKNPNLTNLQKNCKVLIEQYLKKGIDIINYSNLTGSLPVTYEYIDKIKDNNKIIEDKDKDNINNITEDLNLVLGTSYKPTTKQTQDLIKARINDSFTFEDFKTVHRKMLRAWGADDKMVKFLRPITLYGNKFEGYLNQKTVTTKLTPEGVKAYLVGQAWLKQEEIINVK